MRFLRQSMIGLFLAAVTLGLLVFAGYLVSGAVQERMSDAVVAPPARERVFTVNVRQAIAEDVAPILETFGELQSRRLLELRASGGRQFLRAHFSRSNRIIEAQEHRHLRFT